MRIPTEKAHGVQILKMCQAFQEKGISIELVVPFRFNHRVLRSVKLKDYYHLHSDIAYQILPAIDLLPLGKIFRIFQNYFESLFAHIHRFTFSFSFMFYILCLKKDINIIYTRDVNIFALVSPLLNFFLPKLNFVLEIHSIPEIKWRRRRFFKIVSKANLIVSINQQMKQIILKEILQKHLHIIVAHDAVDLRTYENSFEKMELREKLCFPKDKYILSFVGALHTNGQEKGVSDIIKASKIIFGKRSDVIFCFVGGPLQLIKKYKDLISRYSLDQNNYIFIDKKPLAEVPFFLWASDILLMPHPDFYFYKYCISPLKLFEYMASCRPILASAIPSILEILTHKENAYLVQPSSPDLLAVGIEELLSDHDLRDRISKRAFSDVQKMTWENRASEIIKSFDLILKY